MTCLATQGYSSRSAAHETQQLDDTFPGLPSTRAWPTHTHLRTIQVLDVPTFVVVALLAVSPMSRLGLELSEATEAHMIGDTSISVCV